MSENVIRTSFSSLINGCPKCKSKNLYLICDIEIGRICADCGWHEGLTDEKAQEELEMIKRVNAQENEIRRILYE